MNDLIGQTILHYKIIDKLGEGGMGVVYKAEDSKLKREVAIKFLPNIISKSKEDKTRFENEAQAAASLNHPNIATIHAIEEKDSQIFIVMEFINGPELKSRIDEGPITLEESLNIIEQIAYGLAAAHHKGIIHRDIKSSNIMLTQSGQVKIMDFGLAKVKGSSQITKVGTTIGTAAYMSPEQAQGTKVDNRADIWALGVIFYELLTGRQPFKGEFEQAVIYSILNIEPEPVSTIKPDVPLKLEQITKKLLSKDVDLRYQDVASFLSDLKDYKNKKLESKPDNEKTIAVLPFENISPDKETDYFADGLAEELIINLSRIKEVSVVARTTSMQYKGTKKDVPTIGKELGVRYVMEGSVRKFKDDLRISVQFIDVSKGTQLWGETYKGKLEDVFDIQEKVSKEIVDALMLKLSPVEKVELSKRPTLNAEAFDCYLRGRNFLYNRTKSNLDFAILLFQKAVELDSRFAGAYAGLGEAYGTMYRDFDRLESWLDKALDVSLKALMYDPSLSEAYASMGLAYFGKNQLDEALTATKKAVELDPNNINAYWILSRIYISTDRDKEAIEALEKLVKINPHFLAAYPDLHASYERLNDKKNHDRIIQEALKVYPEYLVLHPEDAYRRMSYAVTLAINGERDKAINEGEKALELSPNDPIMMYYGANLYSRLMEKDKAVELITAAVKNGYENFEWIKRDPDFDNIRKEPGFLKLIQGK
jgi:serine/threonine protein kinase/tetratricopeptide (TPR) repeat protein